jgi:hypothetical protein
MPHTHPATTHLRHRRSRRSIVAAVSALAALTLAGSLGVSTGAGADTVPGSSTTRATTSSAAASPAIPSVSAYWAVASDGGVFSFGGAPFYGSTGGIRLNRPVVAITATAPADSGGYREVASDGGIFDYGDAHFYGSTGGMQLNQPIVGMSATTDGAGYWLVAADGGVFTFGDAHFYGSTGAMRLNQPIVGMASTADNRGYWLVAADGGIFAFGDAHFYGSTGNLRLQKPIVAMASTRSHNGYWLVAADGGIFSFGDAVFHGSLGGVPQSRPIVSMATTADGGGYWFTNSNGAVTAFGDATYWGSTPQILSAPVVGMVQGRGTGSFTGSSYPSGSFGYDISVFQCSSLPPSPHTIGIVQVEEPGFLNPCLAKEAAWAGGGLNLYVYMNYGTAASSGDPACASSASPTSCNYGFNAALHAYDDARAAGVNPSVPWWLDIEDSSLAGHQLATQDLVQGAIDALHFAGINSVGIYASPGNWVSLVGNYQPAVPYWAADWQIAPGTTCADVKSLYSGLPGGPVQMVQYSSPSAPLSLGGMSLTYDDDYAC